MEWFPAPPDVEHAHRAVGTSLLRYEDVSQDGRLVLLAIPYAIGGVFWMRLASTSDVARLTHAGVVPILTRLVIEGGSGPISIRKPLDGEGRYQLAHGVDAGGAVERLYLNVWVSLSAPRGRTHGPPPDGAGETLAVGRVFAEHVFTRPFAPAGERKVLRLDLDGTPPVPPARWPPRPPEAVLALPDGAEPLDEALAVDAAPIAFGLDHTDSNQHVNSLVYPRLFLEAALRRFAAHGRHGPLLARRLEVAYRKPCFAGDRARMLVRAYMHEGLPGAVGALVADGADPLAAAARPHCTLQARFAP
jgi:hypothetical protein